MSRRSLAWEGAGLSYAVKGYNARYDVMRTTQLRLRIGSHDSVSFDVITKDEGLLVVAQTLGVVHGIADDMRVVVGGAPCFYDFSQIFV
jgi:hypothetical protein